MNFYNACLILNIISIKVINEVICFDKIKVISRKLKNAQFSFKE